MLYRGIRCFSILAAFMLLVGCRDEANKQAQGGPPPPPPVTAAKPVVKEIVEDDEFTGRFDAVGAVEIRARVGGYLESVNFRDGTIVKEGDLLFVIDRRPYQAALNQAAATLTTARARAEFARVELDRVERLLRSGNAPERTFDERRQQFATAQADIAGAQAAVEQARLDFAFTEIRAPISGRISRKLVTEGNLVKANDTLLTTIVTLDPIYFYFDVDERSYLAYSRMAKNGERMSGRDSGFEVKVALADERRPERAGRMDFVDNRMDAATGTMRGRAVFENKDLFLTPGLFGRISIPGSGKYRGILVPDEAIGSDLDRRIVYAVGPDGTVQQKPVRVGPRIDGYRVIREGLTGDETIVINGLQRLRFGGKVAPQIVELPPQR